MAINHNIGNEWGWFIDFRDEIEIIDELLKPPITYSRISLPKDVLLKESSSIREPSIKEPSIKEPSINTNYTNYIFRLFMISALYKLVSNVRVPIFKVFETLKKCISISSDN